MGALADLGRAVRDGLVDELGKGTAWRGAAMIDLESIRRSNPLQDIAGRLVPLRAAGEEWTACCPFHADRSPSFTIYDAGRRFHCFGCGATGDVLDFVQRASK